MIVVLIDCDNFFASCERVMQPNLANTPVAVLSNNDGCVIARTEEVKKAGVRMGQPYYQCREILKSVDAKIFSANFLLYRHFAKRLQSIFCTLPARDVEVYSIDESFITFEDDFLPERDRQNWAIEFKELIYKWTGMPVSIGIGASRSLAKTAAYIAKKEESHVFVIGSEQQKNKDFLKKIPIQDVWGVGRKLAPIFRASGIRTVEDLSQITLKSPEIKLLNKSGREMVAELCGWAQTRSRDSDQKSIMYTRSFGKIILDIDDLRSAVANFSVSTGHKLRRQKLVTGHVSLFLRYRENSYEKHGKSSQDDRKIAFTNDTFAIDKLLDELVVGLFIKGRKYIKAGIVLSDLRSAEQYQLSLDQSEGDLHTINELMNAIDAISDNFGLTVVSGTSLLGKQEWLSKQEKLSPFNHSSWDSLPMVYAN